MASTGCRGAGTWERYDSEAMLVQLSLWLFADHITIVRSGEELERWVAKTKGVMSRFEEKCKTTAKRKC